MPRLSAVGISGLQTGEDSRAPVECLRVAGSGKATSVILGFVLTQYNAVVILETVNF